MEEARDCMVKIKRGMLIAMAMMIIIIMMMMMISTHTDTQEKQTNNIEEVTIRGLQSCSSGPV